MSKNLETYSIGIDMREDLLNCYREVAPDCIYQATAWKRTIMHPAKSFYITGKQAYQRINMYLKGKTEAFDNIRPLRRQLFYDLLKVVQEMVNDERYKDMSLRQICFTAVNKPAPRFYISSAQMGRIFSWMVRHKCYDRYGRNIQFMERYRRKSINNHIITKQ